LLVNVLKKEVVFAEGIPIIKVCVAGDDVEPAIVRSARENGKPGKVKISKETRVKMSKGKGKDVERNE